MPLVIRKLPDETASEYFKGNREPLDLQPYHDAVAQMEPDGAYAIELDGHTQRALKRRLNQAAKASNYALRWSSRRADGDQLVVQVRLHENGRERAKTVRRRRSA